MKGLWDYLAFCVTGIEVTDSSCLCNRFDLVQHRGFKHFKYFSKSQWLASWLQRAPNVKYLPPQTLLHRGQRFFKIQSQNEELCTSYEGLLLSVQNLLILWAVRKSMHLGWEHSVHYLNQEN